MKFFYKLINNTTLISFDICFNISYNAFPKFLNNFVSFRLIKLSYAFLSFLSNFIFVWKIVTSVISIRKVTLLSRGYFIQHFTIKKHYIYIPKSCKFKLLGKLLIQHRIITLFQILYNEWNYEKWKCMWIEFLP